MAYDEASVAELWAALSRDDRLYLLNRFGAPVVI
jgi:hypothetical protein